MLSSTSPRTPWGDSAATALGAGGWFPSVLAAWLRPARSSSGVTVGVAGLAVGATGVDVAWLLLPGLGALTAPAMGSRCVGACGLADTALPSVPPPPPPPQAVSSSASAAAVIGTRNLFFIMNVLPDCKGAYPGVRGILAIHALGRQGDARQHRDRPQNRGGLPRWQPMRRRQAAAGRWAGVVAAVQGCCSGAKGNSHGIGKAVSGDGAAKPCSPRLG